MPTTRPPRLAVDQLPAVAVVSEIAAFERCDERTIRQALEAGEIPGAFKRGRSWRVRTDVYLAAGCRDSASNQQSASEAGDWLAPSAGSAKHVSGTSGDVGSR
jgi:hypothetical protein